MIASPRIAYLLATAVQSFGDRHTILLRPPRNLLATAKKSTEGILLTITYATCRHQALRL